MTGQIERSPMGRQLRGKKPSSVYKAEQRRRGIDPTTVKASRALAKPAKDLTDYEYQQFMREKNREQAVYEDELERHAKILDAHRRPLQRGPSRATCSAHPLSRAERHVLRNSNGHLQIFSLAPQFWMCRRAGFNPYVRTWWEWWLDLGWQDQLWFYETGVIERRLARELKRKRDHSAAFEGMDFKRMVGI